MPEPSATTISREFRQSGWDDHLADHVAKAARGWFAEDLGHECDWTSIGLVGAGAVAELNVVARKPGVIAGLAAAAVVARIVDEQLEWLPLVADGAAVEAGTAVATLAGPTRSVLTAERVLLNMIGRMSGVATATRLLVDAVAGTQCRVYDTRKTVPGWRLLDKYAVRLGGGWNHRMGLYDAILIKDNHIAAMAAEAVGPAEAVRLARKFVAATFPPSRSEEMIVEIEIDSLQQLDAVLAERPDVVLLDNMRPDQLARGVESRDRIAPGVVLEASGGVRPETIRAMAEAGVDRISAGWPTHGAPWLDIALDWSGGRKERVFR